MIQDIEIIVDSGGKIAPTGSDGVPFNGYSNFNTQKDIKFAIIMGEIFKELPSGNLPIFVMFNNDRYSSCFYAEDDFDKYSLRYNDPHRVRKITNSVYNTTTMISKEPTDTIGKNFEIKE